jgi:phosphotriesterase-related protein
MPIRTVLGDIADRGLGYTHCHDHLFVFKTFDVSLPERLIIDSYEKTKKEVLKFKQRGGGAIVDAQPFGAGRHPLFLKRVAEDTGVHIVSSTGLHKTSFYRNNFWSFDAPVNDIAELFISEIENGMFEYDYKNPFRKQNPIKAGVIKIATESEGLTPYYRKVFDAAVQAHKTTGAPILTHTELSTHGMEQADYLIRGGVQSHKIIISHMDRTIDTKKNIELAGLGVFLQYDTISRFRYHSDKEEVSLIKTMIEEGFENQILFGMDSTRDRYPSYKGKLGLDYVISTFLYQYFSARLSGSHRVRERARAERTYRHSGILLH